jgi:hypothetical protein
VVVEVLVRLPDSSLVLHHLAARIQRWCVPLR